MRAYVLSALVLLTACRDRPSSDPQASASPSASASASATVRPKLPLRSAGGNCTNVCRKSLKCMGEVAYKRQDLKTCVNECEDGKASPVRLSRLYTMDCETLVANLENADGGVGDPAASPCSAQQCAACVWDGESCYSRISPFADCDACCCKKGGPAPRLEAVGFKRDANDATSTP